MRLAGRQFGRPASVDMTPMIDVTFQLIAFFMFVLNFSEVDQDERVRLPTSELAKPSEQPPEHPLTVQLTREGRVIFGGEMMNLLELRRRLVNHADFMARLGDAPEDVTVIVRADADVPTGRVREAILVCQETRFHKFSLRVKQEEPP